MRALVYTGPESLEMRDVAEPIPGTDEKRIRIEVVGICGSDLHGYLGHDPRRIPPLILGHEAVGTLDDGTRVAVNPLIPCMACHFCLSGRSHVCPKRALISIPPREGAFAETLVMPSRNLIPVPESVPPEVAALVEPMACGWHAVNLGVRALSGPLPAVRCLVLGGGGIGVAIALVLRAFGATDVWLGEPQAERRLRAERISGATCFDPGAGGNPCASSEAESFALVLDAVGIDATRAMACKWVAPGGVIVHIGLGAGSAGVDCRRLTLQEISFIGAYTYTPAEFRDAAAAIFAGHLGRLDWADVRPIADGPAAFQELASGRAEAPRILLRW